MCLLFLEIVEMKKQFYLLIAGSRNFINYDFLKRKCDFLLQNHKDDEIHIIAGEARGADQLAKQFAKENNYIYHPFPANWNVYGKAAGYIRNKQMHEFIAKYPNRGCVCFWDGKSKGTAQNFSLAKEYQTELKIYKEET